MILNLLLLFFSFLWNGGRLGGLVKEFLFHRKIPYSLPFVRFVSGLIFCMGFVDRMRTKPSPRCIEFVSTPPKNNRNRRSSRYAACGFYRMDLLIPFRFFLSPFNRFAEFVEGKSHLSDREVLDYETTAYRESETWTDDESDEE